VCQGASWPQIGVLQLTENLSSLARETNTANKAVKMYHAMYMCMYNIYIYVNYDSINSKIQQTPSAGKK